MDVYFATVSLLLFSLSVVSNSFSTSWTGTPRFPGLHHLPEFAHTHVHWVDDVINHLILCRPPLLLPSIFPSFGVFSSESALRIKWPAYWSFSFSISPSSESSLAPQFEASVLQCSAFFVVQFPHPYMTTGKTTTLTRRTFVYRPLPLYDRWYFFYLFHILRLFLVFHC